MDMNVGAFEANHVRIYDFDYENITTQPFDYLSKVKS
jgi:hypothetical protein